jgi:uncharacterized protein
MKKLIGENLHLDWRIALIVVVSTTVLIIDSYHTELAPWKKYFPSLNNAILSTKVVDHTLLFFIIPMLITLLIFRQKAGEYGFRLGHWKSGVMLTLVGMVVVTPIIWLVVHGNRSLQSYYSPQVSGLPWQIFVDLFSWEFFFRGWLLFGLARKFGSEAIWLQAIPFALAHIGKPEVETLSTILGGFAFGWVAWRTKSFIYPFLIHCFVNAFTIILAAGIHM